MINEINLLSENSGVNIASLSNITRVGADIFAASFLPPAEGFVLQLVGMDSNGFNFSYISDTAVEVASIDMALSMCAYVCACAMCPMMS